MRFSCLQIRVQTTDGPYGVSLDFPDGLVVIWADNSMGKSTCVKAMIVALGLEAMLTTSQADLPLPFAVTVRLDSGDQQHLVVESEVLLEIENDRGERIVAQRTIKGTRDKNLITVYEGPALTAPGAFATRDFFVNRAGAATRESGFHHYLAGFLDWQLPTVQTYDGAEYPLYLQCIFPYFIVEQTRGWSRVQPALPTQFRIREANKRAVEFLLNLDAHQNALLRQEIMMQKSHIQNDWSSQVARILGLAERAGAQVQNLPNSPLALWPPSVLPVLFVPIREEWIPLTSRIESRQNDLAILTEQEIPRVQEIASTARDELEKAEERVRERQTLLSRLRDAFEVEQQEVAQITNRLEAIDEDIQHTRDVRTLRSLGSRQQSLVDNGSCPVCHQSLPDSLIPLNNGQFVMSLDESIDFLTEQRRTFTFVLANAEQATESRRLQVRALEEELSSLRASVRTLRQTLISDGRLPSFAAIQARIQLETALNNDQETQEIFDRLLEGFVSLSERWLSAEEAALRLPASDASEEDIQKIGNWIRVLREQLSLYGFGSFSEREISISLDTYKPEHQGFDLEASFSSVENTISASDLIRTIWAYLSGLLELSRTEETNHPGCIIFDEPKQQSTRDVSFASLLRRASAAGRFHQQVIFFTSEDRTRLQNYLHNIPHSLTVLSGRVLRKTD